MVGPLLDPHPFSSSSSRCADSTDSLISRYSFSQYLPIGNRSWQVLYTRTEFMNVSHLLVGQCWCVLVCIYPTPPHEQDVTQGQFFKWSKTGLNSEFSFSLAGCLNKARELSLPYYLTIAGGRIIGFIPFPRVLVLCETQSTSSRI